MKSFYNYFDELTRIPRPSHHEEKVADYLCRFAETHHLKYRRDAQNCVVIEKPASVGYEKARPVVILNHMDMVCVSKDDYLRNGRPFNPLLDEIRPYVVTDENGNRWMKAEGTSLGADNGIGLSMALAILADDTLPHPALEVLTTTNEEDGMSGAEALSLDFIRGRRVINLDSEAYDEITIGAAGAYLQKMQWDFTLKSMPASYVCRRIVIDGGLGGHSGVDINKHRCNCIMEMFHLLEHELFNAVASNHDVKICSINGGTANASIPSWADVVIAIPENMTHMLEDKIEEEWNAMLLEKYKQTDPNVRVRMEKADAECYMQHFPELLKHIVVLPYGVMSMRQDMPQTVMTSNNVGMLRTDGGKMTLTCHTRSFDNEIMERLGEDIWSVANRAGATGHEVLMNTGAWEERRDSPLLALTCKTFNDVLGFEPRKVAMHFVLEAAYYVEKYPGIEMSSIGPCIIEPHSTSERVNLNTADDIWRVTIELLKRMTD